MNPKLNINNACNIPQYT